MPLSFHGGKTISTFGSICLISNNVIGPAMVSIGTSFAQAGWLPTVALLLTCALLSGMASAFLCETIRHAPGNRHFTKRIEITDALKLARVPRPFFFLCFYSFVLLFIANNTAAIVESAQTTDQLLVHYAGRSCAVTLYPNPGHYVCAVPSTNHGGPHRTSDSPFGEGAWVVSWGFVLTACVVLPLSFLSLDENALFQKMSFVGLCLIALEWVFHFTGQEGLRTGSPPALGEGTDCLHNLFGNVMFNFAFVLTLPSWLNEKKTEVSESLAISTSLVITTVLFVAIGFTAASAEFNRFATTDDDITTVLIDSNKSDSLTRLGAFVFPPVVLWSGIPVCAIVVRYNLIVEGVLGPCAAAVVAAFLPWALALLLYAGTLLNSLTSWSGLFLVVPLNFILPCVLYLLRQPHDESKQPMESSASSTLLSGNAGIGGGGGGCVGVGGATEVVYSSSSARGDESCADDAKGCELELIAERGFNRDESSSGTASGGVSGGGGGGGSGGGGGRIPHGYGALGTATPTASATTNFRDNASDGDNDSNLSKRGRGGGGVSGTGGATARTISSVEDARSPSEASFHAHVGSTAGSVLPLSVERSGRVAALVVLVASALLNAAAIKFSFF